jgi:hypothetical protein
VITGAETAHLNPKTPTIFLEGRLPLVVERTAAELGLRDGQIVQATVEARLQALRLNLQGPPEGRFIDLPRANDFGLDKARKEAAAPTVPSEAVDGSDLPQGADPAAAPVPMLRMPPKKRSARRGAARHGAAQRTRREGQPQSSAQPC